MQPQGIIHERVEAARRGDNRTVICRVRSGWVVLGDRQFIPGYALLLSDPVASSLNDLAPEGRSQFLSDMSAIGDALLRVTDAVRINYSIYGNADPALHAHVFPRYATEPDAYRTGPVWVYRREQRDSLPFDLRRDRSLMDAIHRELKAAGACI